MSNDKRMGEMREMSNDFFQLTKPGLVLGNLIPVIAGFVLGSREVGSFVICHLSFVILGLAFVMASGCVFNNIIERDTDSRMTRTKERALVTGKISPRNAFIFGTVLAALGFAILDIFTNPATVAVALIGFFFYVALYSAWFKRHSVWGTLVGAVAGATPPVIGYLAAGGSSWSLVSGLLFLMIFWQLAHFYAIGIRRRDDYAAAGIPILPVQRGAQITQLIMLFCIAAFMFFSVLIAYLGYASGMYAVIAMILSLAWIVLCLSGMISNVGSETAWARRMFLFSLVVLMVLFGAMVLV